MKRAVGRLIELPGGGKQAPQSAHIRFAQPQGGSASPTRPMPLRSSPTIATGVFPMPSLSARSFRHGAAASLLAALLLNAAPALAQDGTGGDASRRVITVTGEGEASVAPDMAIVNLTVLREGATAREALDAGNAAMAEVLAAMREAGIADRDLQTSGFGIAPQYVYPENGQSGEGPRITGYQVTNSLSVRVRDLAELGGLLDQAVSLGVNQGGDILFTNDDPAAAMEEARRGAVEDARSRAETLVEAAGVGLGEIVRIDESVQQAPPMPMMRAEMARSLAADAAVPVATGENTYAVTVTITWELGSATQQ
jgi:uncharacterized protein YggE